MILIIKKYLFRGLIVLMLFMLMATYGQKSQQRPNLVMYVADDLGVWDIGPYGNDSVKTPHLDALREESMLFEQAFSASPTCTPARSALLTGLYPHKNGAHVNRMPVRDNIKSIAWYFNHVGYKVAIAGKLHVGPREAFAFEYVEGTNLRESGTEGLKGMFTDLYLSPVDEWLGNNNGKQPFVLLIMDHCTHMTWPLNPKYTNKTVKIPPFFVDTKDTRRLLARYYTDITKMDNNVGDVMNMLEKHKLTENTIMMFTADQGPQLPFGKWTLYDYGLQVPLMVRWPGYVKPGSKTDALVSHIDFIPTLLEAVGETVPDGIDGKSFYHVLKDPHKEHRETVFAAHNGDKFHDKSPTRMLRTDKYKYIVNLDPKAPVSNGKKPRGSWVKKANTDKHAKIIVDRLNQRPVEELYDIENDRFELNNLAHLEEYQELLKYFRKQMATIRNDQGDVGDNWKEDMNKLPTDNKPNPLVPYQF